MIKNYAIILDTKHRAVPVDRIKDLLDDAKSWAKFTSEVWFIVTNETTSYWYEKMRSILHVDDHVLVVELDLPHRRGWVPTLIADWFDKDHSSKPGT